MVLRIETTSEGEFRILRISGRIERAHMHELMPRADTSQKIVLDLANVKLVDREVAIFLGQCETRGIELRNCPAYIREWIRLERAR